MAAQQISISPNIGVYIPTAELVKAAGGEEFKQEISLLVGGRLGLGFGQRVGLAFTADYSSSELRFSAGGPEERTPGNVLSGSGRLTDHDRAGAATRHPPELRPGRSARVRRGTLGGIPLAHEWTGQSLGRSCVKLAGAVVAAMIVLPATVQGQESSIVGTWRVAAKVETRGGPREVIIRPDSSASWGRETSRWRLAGDSIAIAIGGEWEVYRVKVGKKALTLSGGDLQKPITLTRVGAATPRPAGVAVPPDPDSGS